MNIDEQIEREGLSFLELMREMMKHDPEEEQKNSYLGDLIEDDSMAKALDSKDEYLEPKKVAKIKRQRRAKSAKSEVKRKKKTGYNLDGSKRVKRILLDEALKNKDTNMDDWSEARKKAYKAIKQNPNTYHYRFNKPGEAQAKGGWTKDEHKRFMQVLMEKGANKNWGLFSINVKGRVGYQCSNYYRLLVKHIKIWDPNYWYDERLLGLPLRVFPWSHLKVLKANPKVQTPEEILKNERLLRLQTKALKKLLALRKARMKILMFISLQRLPL